jgi:aspartate oxidase
MSKLDLKTSSETKTVHDVSDSKQFKSVKKKLGDTAAKNMTEKSVNELKEFISATAGLIQKERDAMQSTGKYKAAVESKKECEDSFKDAIKESKLMLDLAVLVYSKKL